MSFPGGETNKQTKTLSLEIFTIFYVQENTMLSDSFVLQRTQLQSFNNECNF